MPYYLRSRQRLMPRSSFSRLLVFALECGRHHELVADAILRFAVFDLPERDISPISLFHRENYYR